MIDELHAAATKLISQVPHGADGFTCKDLFPDVYRISVSARHELFVAEIAVDGGSLYYLILYDPATGAVTHDPPSVDARWTENFGAKDPLLKKPFVSSADLFQNHHPQIVIEERLHNGPGVNGVAYHYFDIGPNLALTRVLTLEARMMAYDPPERMFERELTQLSPTRLRLDTFAVPCDDSAHGKFLGCDDSAHRKELGYAILESDGANAPFHVMEQHPKDGHLKSGLVTGMGDSSRW